MNENVSMAAAFVGGIVSFFSPCVLPLVPFYISYISGVSIKDIIGEEKKTKILRKPILSSLMFIIGFSIIFVLLGASATLLGQFLLEKVNILSKFAGIIIIVFGLHTLGLFRIGFLNYEKRLQTESKPVGLFGPFVIGLAFAFGWTPCVGPILSAILALAGTQKNVGRGVVLLSIYSLGLGLPFLLTGIGTDTFLGIFNKIKRYFRIVELISGLLLVIVGLMIFFNSFSALSGYITKLLPWLNFG